MAYLRNASSFFLKSLSASSGRDLSAILREMCDQFGWSNLTYFGSGLPGTNFGEDLLITTYHEEWVKRYNVQQYQYIDPIVAFGSQSLLPIDWFEIPKDSSEVKKFFGEATELGVGVSGLTVAVRGIHGDSSLFSVNSTEVGAAWQSHKRAILSDITYLAHLFHDVVWERSIPESPSLLIRLSRREQDVLRWAAKGKTAWETAKILDLSEKTVSFYLSNATVKLNAATKTEAVTKAISSRLVIM